ncbi:MAG: DNA polymerase III subunit beta [Candidatus Fonsibacter ubiquis]
MKITASQSDLSHLLRTVAPAVARNPSHPILSHVLLIASPNGQLIASTYNLKIGITASCVAAVDTEGSICLPAQVLREIIDRSDDDDAITISAADDSSTIAAAGSTYQLPTQPADDFPDLPVVAGKGQQLDLGAAARAALAVVSTDAAKAILQGVRVADGHVCATDGHRMLRWPVEGAAGVAVTLPSATVKLIGSEPAVISVERGHAAICLPDCTIHSRIIDGAYPDVAKLIPQTFEARITCDRHRLTRALERVAVVAEAHNNVVKLTITDGELVITADADGRNGCERLLCDGPDAHWAFNVRYLLDGLKVFRDCDTVTISGNSPTTPVVLTGSGMAATYLVMPVQVRE